MLNATLGNDEVNLYDGARVLGAKNTSGEECNPDGTNSNTCNPDYGKKQDINLLDGDDVLGLYSYLKKYPEDETYVVLEMNMLVDGGEGNDVIQNDIMTFKRDLIELMHEEGINKFILIGDNVLNFHASDDSYYEEWYNDIDDGWIALINFRDHVLEEFKQHRIDYYLNFGGELDTLLWRKFTPLQMFKKVEEIIQHRLN
jgi:hypothetical protein